MTLANEDGLFRLIVVDERGRRLAHCGQMRCAMHRYARRVFGAMPARRELNTFKWTIAFTTTPCDPSECELRQ
eukprot:COSAG06_NODE_204_length_20326_cov_8.096060_4_plen_73_part_00